MISAELSLWLRCDPDHVEAMCSLVESTDLAIVSDLDTFTVRRCHDNSVTRYECGPLPPMPATIA
jgi:hypothetical protein